MSPVSVTTHFNCSGVADKTNLSCFLTSLLYKGTGKRWAHSYLIEWFYKKVSMLINKSTQLPCKFYVTFLIHHELVDVEAK